ncbi:MAG: cadherin-like domain-containing protein, partial [Victivallales bacterium]|nr:cadherin-like domain-containing protein [Victivallales bacterium]
SGFGGKILLTNTTGKTSDGWTVEFDYPYNINSMWGAKIKSHNGNHYIIENQSWNKALAQDKTVSIGFNGSPGNATEVPANVEIDMNNGGSPSQDPVANKDFFTTDKGTAKTVNVLANDTGSNIKIQTVSDPQYGTAANTDSKVTYNPTEGYTGDDSFTYTIVDKNGKTSEATVDVTVKKAQAPTAEDDSVFVHEGTAQTIDVLANDKGEGLTVNTVTRPGHGTAAIENNRVKYTPASGYTGSDSFTYTVKNAAGLTAVGTVAVTVKKQVALNKVNATYWCIWGGNTSYNVDGKQIKSKPVEMDKIDPSYNVIITAFIVTDTDGNYTLAFKDPGSTAPSTYTPEQVKSFIEKTKAQGRKVIVSLGGQFFDMKMSSNEDVDFFVSQAEKIIDEYGFEGIDLDLEHNSLSTINPELLSKAVKEVINHYRNQGKDFWLTAAPEWGYIIPYTYGSGKWASHSMEGVFFKKLISDIGIDNFNYIWPQTYNQGPANGITGADGSKVSPANGMDNFLAAMSWGISTNKGYKANGSKGVFIPADKLCLGIPATEGAAGGKMSYIATPELIKSTWDKMTAQNSPVSGFMNWSVDWDAMNIADGDLSPGYSHPKWATGRAVADVIGSGSDINLKPTVNFTTPANSAVIEQNTLSPVNIAINVSDSDGTVVESSISVDGHTYNGISAEWTPSDFGTYNVTAKALDNKGAETVRAITVTIEKDSGGSGGDNLHPNVSFNTPYNNEVIRQETLSPVHISVSADDPDGKVKSVVIDVDGKTFVGSTADWTPSGFRSYTVTATAIDNLGAVTEKSVDVAIQAYDPSVERKQVVGYFTQWDAWKGTKHGYPAKGTCNQLNVDYSKYTILNFSFFGVAKDGSLHSGDYRNKNIYKEGEVQEPAQILHGDVYSSWDYWLLYGELDLLWENTQEAKAKGFVVDGNSWYNTKTGLSGKMPIPMHKEGGAKGLIQLCHENNVKLIATIGGWSMCKHIPEMAADPVKKARFLEDCRTLIDMGFDGIDIDWEFPGPFPGMNYTGSEADYANFTKLMRDIRNTIGPNKILTAAFSCVPERLEGFNWSELNRYMDYFNMMTYDMNGGWSKNAGHHSPLYGSGLCWDKTFKFLTQEKHVPANKINMGLGFYGRGVVTDGQGDLGAPTVKTQRVFGADGPVMTASDFANWSAFEGTPNYGYIMQNKQGWTYHWDDTAKVPYLTKDNYFLSYDDENSIQCKADYVMDHNAGGVIIWQVFGDWDAGKVEKTYAKKLPYCSNVSTPLLDIIHHTFESDGKASYL